MVFSLTKRCLVLNSEEKSVIFKCLTVVQLPVLPYSCIFGLEFSFTHTFSTPLCSDQPHCLRAGYSPKCFLFTLLHWMSAYSDMLTCLSYSPSVLVWRTFKTQKMVMFPNDLAWFRKEQYNSVKNGQPIHDVHPLVSLETLCVGSGCHHLHSPAFSDSQLI